MNPNVELSVFYERILADARIGTTHICLFMAFYQLWNLNGWRNPVLIKRHEVMELAKIGSTATYHKCLRQLIECGFVFYRNHVQLNSCFALRADYRTKEKWLLYSFDLPFSLYSTVNQ